MPTALFYAALNRKLGARLGQVLSGTFAAKLEPLAGTSVSTARAAIGPQVYDVVNADGARPGDALTLVNIGRPAVALYSADLGSGGSVVFGAGGGSTSASSGSGSGTPGTPSPFDDADLVRRDGAHSLYGAADWAWDVGAKVAGAVQAGDYGTLRIIGALRAGQSPGGHVMLREYIVDVDGTYVTSDLLQVADVENVPLLSAGVLGNYDPDGAWVNIGREGGPRIHTGPLAGYERHVPLVDAELVSGVLSDANIPDSIMRNQATQIGQVAFSTDGATLTPCLPLTDAAGWLVEENSGIMLVVDAA